MKLQFLIPQYKETEQVIKPLLDSIALQQNVDFNEIEIIITNDGTDIYLSEDFLKSYPFNIEYYKAPHRGVSATRNYCLDKATADYVMFCDADDMFYNMLGLFIIFQQIDMGFEILNSVFSSENRNNNDKPVYVDHRTDVTFVHGKVYNRNFLIENNIRWNETLTVHEDSFFNYLCWACANPNQVRICKYPFYLWKHNPNSVSRQDKDYYILKTFNNFLDSSTCLLKELLQRNLIRNARIIATNMFFECFLTLNKKEWLEQENQEYRNNVEKRFKKFFLDFKNLFDELDDKEKNKLLIKLKNRKYNEGMIMESITFDDWIQVILKK